ncbi:MAG: caspase family protein [Deferribacterales bacterium]
MRRYNILLIFIILAVTGCGTFHYTLPFIQPPVDRPNVQSIDMKTAVIMPDDNELRNNTIGNTTTSVYTGKLISSMNRKYMIYTFTNPIFIRKNTASEEADAVVEVDVQSLSFNGIMVALGFGMKFEANLTLKASVRNRNNQVIWETSANARSTSRSVVSPVIPHEQLKAEALSQCFAACYKQITEEMSMAYPLKQYAAKVKSAPQAVAKTDTRQAPADTSPKAWLGVHISDYDAVSMKNNRRMRILGASVTGVEQGSPAFKSGVRVGDILLEVSGEKVTGAKSMADIISSRNPDTDIILKINRSGSDIFQVVHLVSKEPVAQSTKAVDSYTPILAPHSGSEELPEYRSDAFAVVIGIDYAGRKDIPGLKYASVDAKKVYEVITDKRYGGINPENSVLLLNDKATRNNIISALRKIRTWDGYVYVYFSGHGAPITTGDSVTGGVIIPYDAVISDPEAMKDTAVSISYIQNALDNSNAKGVLVALDACFTGTGKSVTPKGGKPIVGMMVANDIIKTTGAGKLILTSSAADQQSWEDDNEFKSGIFSHYLIDGIMNAGQSAWISVKDLADYVMTNVPKASSRLKGEPQTPQLIGKGDFVVSRNWKMSKELSEESAKSKLKAAFENGDINAAQLSKALDEVKNKTNSKLMDSFLNGKIDSKTFGELY